MRLIAANSQPVESQHRAGTTKPASPSRAGEDQGRNSCQRVLPALYENPLMTALPVALLLFQAGCGGAGKQNGAQILSDLQDAAELREARSGQDARQEAEVFTLTDSRGEGDGNYDVDVEDESGLLLLGAPCSENSQCASGWCLEGDNGSICTDWCMEECPPGWRCTTVVNAGPDLVSLCVPIAWLLCKECKTDADCGGAADRCLKIGTTGNYCGTSCAGNADCPTGYVCQNQEGFLQCVPETGSCICTAELLGTKRPCQKLNSFGLCTGEEVCSGPDGWTDCSAPVPMAEVCNGIDDDCDGEVDDQIAIGECLIENEWGSCTGKSVCIEGKTECLGNQAGFEACDGIDNDCDGKTDEDYPLLGVPCDSEDEDNCAEGVWSCAPDGKSLVCEENYHAVEVCDGLDNDCDGKVDEEGATGCIDHFVDKDGDSFGAGVPACLCKPSGDYNVTVGGDCNDENPEVHPKGVETCNSMDDDCDDLIDEANAFGCKMHYVDDDGDMVGDASQFLCLCGGNSTFSTVYPGDCNDLDPKMYPGNTEWCDGIDNDCDGKVDNNAADCVTYYLDQDGDGFGVDAGAECVCAPHGQFTAVVSGDCNDLEPANYPGNTEVCDGKDNDCDFEADEEGALMCKNYYPDLDNDGFGAIGMEMCLCKPTFSHNVFVGGDCDDADPWASPATSEVCDGVDNNCNGKVDEPGAEGCQFYYKDVDQDGFGVSNDGFCLCQASPPYEAKWGGDCDDSDPTSHPGILLTCIQDSDCCITGESCYQGFCLPSPQPCLNGDGCINDTTCQQGECLPFATPLTPDHLSTCTRPYNPGIFLPAVQCQWTGPPPGDPFPNNVQVLSTPVVADFKFPGAKGEMRPSIVFTSYAGTDGGFASGSANGIIRILDGATCTQLYSLGAHKTVGSSTPALADIDLAADNRPEIVAFAEGGGMVAFKYNEAQDSWGLLWHSRNANGSTSTLASTVSRWNGPSVYDLDGNGTPEILMGGVVHNSEGYIIAENLGYLNYNQGHVPVVADVDLDGKAELVMGNGIYEFKGNQWVKESYFKATVADGFVAVANFGDYPVSGLPKEIPEIAVISAGTARIMRLDGQTVFGPYTLPSYPEGTAMGHGGPPTIGDFDGDGKPELATAGKGAITVFDIDCDYSPVPLGCQAKGILWSRQTQDYSSSVTGSSIFDFEADGLAEAVYADECFTRVYSGLTGDVLFSQPHTSCTWYENPIIADVDGDFKSEIVAGSNTNCGISCPSLDPVFRGLKCKSSADCPGGLGSCVVGYCRCKSDLDCGGPGSGFKCTNPLPNTPGTGMVCRTTHTGPVAGIIVFRDIADAWVDSRPIWNQHAYFVNNVETDGKIPPIASGAPQNWQIPGLNNFRQNVQGDYSGLLAPDLTVDPGLLTMCTSQGLNIPVAVCNRGAAPVDLGVPVGFFLGNPDLGGKIQCLHKTTLQLFPGDCEEMDCMVALFVGSPPTDIFVKADFGGAKGEHTECFEDNNVAIFPAIDCAKIW